MSINAKVAAAIIEKEKKELQDKVDKLLQDFEANTGIKISLLQLMRMGHTDSETSLPCTLIMLEI